MVDAPPPLILTAISASLPFSGKRAAGHHGPDSVQHHGSGGIHRFTAEFVQPQPADETGEPFQIIGMIRHDAPLSRDGGRKRRPPCARLICCLEISIMAATMATSSNCHTLR